jgi:hypothetical protein
MKYDILCSEETGKNEIEIHLKDDQMILLKK